MTAAHKHLPFDSLVEVHNRDNGRKVRVRINDRGPFVRGRIIDLSRRAAEEIGMLGPGTARVRIKVVSKGRTPSKRTRPRNQDHGSFTIQLGAFQQGHRAEALADRARTVQPGVEVRYDGSLFRVEAGPFDRRDKAERAAGELARHGFEALVKQRS